jgi:hypothetical protein
MADMTVTYAEVAGNPGLAADLPVTTGRDPEAGTPDQPVDRAHLAHLLDVAAPAGAKKLGAVASGTAAAVIAAVQGQIGYHEGYSDGHWNNVEKYAGMVPGMAWVSDEGQPWCAVFACWGFQTGGLPAGSYPVTASCAEGVSWWKSKNRWSDYPAVGAQVFYGPGGGSHTGIVVAYDNDFVYTVEGNTNDNGSSEGDGVYVKKRLRRDSWVFGYGYPAYPGGIVSADPAWQNQQLTTKPAPAPTPKPTPPPTPAIPPFPGRDKFGPGCNNAYVTQWGRQLVKIGYGSHYQVGPGPVWSEADRLNTADFQRSRQALAGDADGLPGPLTWQLAFEA